VLDDARPHSAAATVNHIAIFGWELLDHTPYSPDLAPSDFHFFRTFKRTLEGGRFTTNVDVEAAVRTQDTDFYHQWLFKLVKRWDKCIHFGGDYVEK
jgi:histone-lysine N-methyltransferase SETMAR